jgi:Ice-binding-like
MIPRPNASPALPPNPKLIGRKPALVALVLAAGFSIPQASLQAAGPAPVYLGAAGNFTILAGAAVTTTGGGIINGDVGASPISGAAIHLTDAQVNGTIYAVDAAGPSGSVIAPSRLAEAMGDLTTAFNDAAGRTPIPSGPFLNPGAGNLGGLNLAAGLYKFTGTALITGSNLTLTGGPDDVWIFQIAADLQVGSTIHVILAGGAQARNIFWQVGTSAVVGTFAVFKGTILADQAITMNTSSAMDGKALASIAGVTFNGDVGGNQTTLEPPVFTAISRTPNGTVTLVLRTTPFYLLTLQTSTTLLPGSWKTIASDTPVSSPWTYVHNATLATGPKRFYRAFLTPE